MRIQNSCLKYKKLYNISAVIPLKKGIRKMKKKGQTGKDMEELYQLIEEKIKMQAIRERLTEANFTVM